jgi:hypothetical protein
MIGGWEEGPQMGGGFGGEEEWLRGRSGRRGWGGSTRTEEIEGKRKRIGFRWVGGVGERGSRELGCSWARGPEVE